MRRVKLLALAALALFAFGAVSAAVANAEEKEEKSNPRILCLETGCIKGLEVKELKGGASILATLAGLTVEGTGVVAKVANCKALAGTEEKDTNLCENQLIRFTGVHDPKSGAKCNSEGLAAGEVEALLDLHMAAEEAKEPAGVLEPLLLAKVLNTKSESPLKFTCALVLKVTVLGTIGCLLLPGLTNIPTTTEVEVLCKINETTHDPITGKCNVLCEGLEKDPFLAKVGELEEDAWMLIHLKGKANKDIYIDD